MVSPVLPLADDDAIAFVVSADYGTAAITADGLSNVQGLSPTHIVMGVL